MFILSSILNITNGYSIRRSRTPCKDRTCKTTIGRIQYGIRDSKARSPFSGNGRGLGESNVSICSKSKQRTLSSKECRIRVYLSLIPLFIFYNPYILIAIIYIDMLFADELIYINIMQINVIIESLQRFNNIGVV